MTLPPKPVKQQLGAETRQGLADFLQVAVPVTFFGLMFGAAAITAGQSFANTVWASIAIFAGASQFVFLEVYQNGVPAWSVLLAVFAVNFRHILYSAAIARKIAHFGFLQKYSGLFLLTDLQFAAVEARAEKLEKDQPITPAYYFGFGIACYVLWIAATIMGALFGGLISNPEMFGLDFILPIYFASILMGFRKRSRFAVIVLISGAVAVLVQKTIGAPWHISLGGLAGIFAAALLAKGGKVVDVDSVEGVMPDD